jgi:PPOX class probable F420-dependent enzyme
VIDERNRLITELFASEPFIDLVSFRSDGTAAHTPVWVSGSPDELFVSTFAHSYKVARIRRNPIVGLAVCDGPGNVKADEKYVAGVARILDSAEFKVGVNAHKRKYGRHFAMMWPARWPLRLIGKRRVWIIIVVDAAQPLPVIDYPVVEPPTNSDVPPG